MKLNLVVCYLVYLCINSLFVVKYGARVAGDYTGVIFGGYLLAMGIFPFIYSRLTLSKTFYRVAFISLFTLFFIGTIYVNYTVDGNSLQVDRWFAMDVGIEALLHGEYPYAAVDELGGRTSNLPTLLFIGVPFYLLGSVGYLQSFCFLIFGYAIYRAVDTFKDRLFGLLFLVLAPSYLWEVYVKSDLMSNFILVLLVVVLAFRPIFKNKNNNTFVLAVISASVILTRLIAIIPITLALFKKIISLPAKAKGIFISLSLLILLACFYLCFQHVGTIENFKKYNPFELQNRQLPTLLSVVFLLLPLYYAYKVKDLTASLKYSVLLLLLPVTVAFGMKLWTYGFNQSLFDSAFDISYFNIVMPFLLVYLTRLYAVPRKQIAIGDENEVE